MFPSFNEVTSSSLINNYKLQEGYSQIAQNLAHALLEQGDVNLLDVRTKEEFDEGHIEGALNCSHDIIYTYKQLPFNLDKDKPLLIYCRSGHRANEIGPLLHSIGYKYVLNFGGVLTWKYGLINNKG